ncbi:MAG: POTRA domain-containing protein [Limisphaerales bacterium]
MKLFLRFNWLVLIWVGGAAAFAQTVPIISKIELKHVGPPAASEALIRANIRVKEGEQYQRARIDDDVRNLYATGYFYNIRVAEEFATNAMKLTYVLQGNPLLTNIKFSGNRKFSNRKLLKKITSKAGQPLNERKLFTDAQELTKIYQKVGYQKTTVKPVLHIDEKAGRGSVTFEITETGKIKIQKINFAGARAFSERKLRRVLKTKERSMLSWLTGSGVLKNEQFQDDKERLLEFYQNEGYIDFEIKNVKFIYVGENKLNLRFILSEGTRYKVGALSLKGNQLFSTKQILKEPDEYDGGKNFHAERFDQRCGSASRFLRFQRVY